MSYIRGFASDNNSGIHPDILQSIVDANVGHAVGYGDDEITARTKELFKSVFGLNADVYFVYNGTGANVVAIQALTQSFNAIICPETAHINVDECGAPEKHTGCKLIPVKTHDGKLTINHIKKHLHGIGFEHHSQPNLISITQATELGTIYTLEEVKEISEFAHSNNMKLHMDGARLANAAASLNCSLKEITVDAGVDVLSFGGTKNGLMFGEAVVFFGRNTSVVKYFRKQSAQLHSKMRFISAQFEALLKNDLWLSNAMHSNKMAKLLEGEISKMSEIKISQPVQSNGVFAIVPSKIIEPLRNKFFFYDWNPEISEVRWMTSFDTQEDDVNKFIEALKRLLYNNT